MSPHLTSAQMEAWRQRSLPAADLLAVDDHLTECADCRAQLFTAAAPAEVGPFRSDLRAAAAEPAHLEYEQLVAFVEGTMGEVDREIATGHLGLCAPCAAEAEELRAFRALMSTQPAKEHAPPVPLSSWERFRAALRRPAVWLPLQVAGVAAAAALAVFFLFGRGDRNDLARQAAQLRELRQANASLRRNNEELQPKVAALPQLESKVNELQREADQARLENERLKKNAGPTGPPKPGTTPGGKTAPAPGRPPLPDAARTALASQQLPLPASVQGLIGKQGTLAGDGGSGLPFALLAPLGTVAAGDRPTFRWKPLEGATRYHVTIAGADGSEVASGETAGGTEWTLPEPLPRGRTYQWEVQAFQGDKELDKSPKPPAPEAKFQVAEMATLENLAGARRRYARQLTYEEYQLTMAALYAQAGLLDDAQGALQQLLEATPRDDAARRLLQDLERKRKPAK